jgi:hypothetical protein
MFRGNNKIIEISDNNQLWMGFSHIFESRASVFLIFLPIFFIYCI